MSEPQVIVSVGDAEMIKTKSGIQYRVAGLWVQSADVYFAYVLTLIADAMTNGANNKQIGKPVDPDKDQEGAA
jgi:hypothetical protein